MKKYRVLFGGLALAVGSGVGAAGPDILPTIEVEAERSVDAGFGSLAADSPELGVAADGGEWLLSVPGVSGVRMGGHGVDPVIRGQRQTQLNVLLDGAYVHGGCPNRMDPPSSYASPEIYDRVTVIKGVQTLIYGGGGPGGTVLFERSAPGFADGEHAQGRLGGGYASNGDVWDAFGELAAGSSRGYVRGVISRKEAGNYQDGSGVSVRSAYNETSGILDLGYNLDEANKLQFSAESVRGTDILFAGAGMDAPISDNDTVKLSFEKVSKLGPFEGVRAQVYHSDVYHVMDNYSLRPVGMMYMRVPSRSLTKGGRVIGDLGFESGTVSVGLDYQQNDRDATRYTGAMPDPTMTSSYLWPGVEIRQMGIFAEQSGEMGGASRYTAGLRFDHVTAGTSKASVNPPGMPPSADTLYQRYYGVSARTHREDNIGGLLRLEHDLSRQGTGIFGAISRTARTADATERYIASWNMTPSMQWVGNPALEPEIHNQIEVGGNWAVAGTEGSGSIYYDRVDDYILRDRAHLPGDNATIYRNVAARLAGLDLEVSRRWSPNLASRFTLAYVRATNASDGRPIAQTPPLESTLSLDYSGRDWLVGGVVRMAAKQTRVDDNPLTGSGLDFGQTPGFAILDLYASTKLGRVGKLSFGVKNVFDLTYAEHLNKSNAFDVNQIQVHEPGRSLWLRASAAFQ
jgi:iron complex outermembrane receptor protein